MIILTKIKSSEFTLRMSIHITFG